jgi:hypothetical protein
MKKISIIFVFVLLMFGGCTRRIPDTPMTQLQIREIQSRDFDTKDTRLVMKSMMDVLQDEGYVIKNAVLDLGLLNAEKNIDIENRAVATRASMWGGRHARWEKQLILEASANVTEFGDKTRVRINFQVKKIDNLGLPVSSATSLDAQHYQYFFEKVSRGIFLQQEGI